MEQQQSLKEYLYLEFTDKPRTKLQRYDKILKPLILLRESCLGDTIHYLYNGSSLFIPWKWINIFSGFSVYSGDKVIYGEEGFIKNNVLFQTYLCRGDGEKALTVLSEICDTGTSEFREWIKTDIGIELDPFIFRSIDKELEI